MKRTDYGSHKYECRVVIQNTRILLGYYELRAQAVFAEQVAVTIRQALDRADTIKRKATTSSGRSELPSVLQETEAN
jgi:hypothetical protein